MLIFSISGDGFGCPKTRGTTRLFCYPTPTRTQLLLPEPINTCIREDKKPQNPRKTLLFGTQTRPDFCYPYPSLSTGKKYYYLRHKMFTTSWLFTRVSGLHFYFHWLKAWHLMSIGGMITMSSKM